MPKTAWRGFALLETFVALLLVAGAMTALLVAFVGSSKYGVLARRQATAVALAQSLAGQLNHVDYTDPRIANNNALNDASFADPAGLFALPTLPTGADPNAPDASLGTFTVGIESYDVYVNVAPLADPVNPGLEQGRQFAVIVGYRVGSGSGATYMRAVAQGYRYNPAPAGVGTLPL